MQDRGDAVLLDSVTAERAARTLTLLADISAKSSAVLGERNFSNVTSRVSKGPWTWGIKPASSPTEKQKAYRPMSGHTVA